MRVNWNEFIDTTVGKATKGIDFNGEFDGTALTNSKVDVTYSQVELEMLSTIAFGHGFNFMVDAFVRNARYKDVHVQFDGKVVWKATLEYIQRMMLDKLMISDTISDDYQEQLTIEV